MATINSAAAPWLNYLRQTLSKENKSSGASAHHVTEDEGVEERNETDGEQKLAMLSDEMSLAMTQFGLRRQSIKREQDAAESFEHILEDDVVPKVDMLLKLSATRKLSLESLLQQARAAFPDESDLVMVLRELLRRRQLTELVKQQLQALLKLVELQAAPRELKAGINCGLKARLFGLQSMQMKPALLRLSYRQFLKNERHEVKEYQDWITCYGYLHRARVLEFIEAALVADMLSQDPSCSRGEFGTLITKLGQLKRLRSGDYLFINTLLSPPRQVSIQKSEKEWLILFMSILECPELIALHLQDNLGELFLMGGYSERASLLGVIYKACKSLPNELFIDPASAPLLLTELKKMTAVAYRHELISNRKKDRQ